MTEDDFLILAISKHIQLNFKTNKNSILTSSTHPRINDVHIKTTFK